AFFGEKYGDKVTIYTIGNEKTGIVSKEVCGGPHVARTGGLGLFKLGKEEPVSAGIRRVYAFLEPK
ncbi:MAG: alanine--tRNA ligase, partial [Patescibacteria group bacterium]